MARRLKAHVHVAGKAYGPSDEVPATVAKRIGEHAWEEDAEQTSSTQASQEVESVEEPPRSGRGSGVDAWRAFAEAHGVAVDDQMSRDDVIAACEQAGLIEPEQTEG
ncbi:hypothetical protein [Streptomyces sp. B15]|uniref:hypothetical protein n=1 Tax=Streptomyces sp. B15 TaxID=1537797 RepID=UPI001B393E30|nr:hypothetical protein [Streptomyces sp. B15]MBQ1122642.1 hypothetical protein [Streptomyces sp. B15]